MFCIILHAAYGEKVGELALKSLKMVRKIEDLQEVIKIATASVKVSKRSQPLTRGDKDSKGFCSFEQMLKTIDKRWLG